ncbi:hypothetical protein L218DRAFT_955774 [Marasmius fiardii PR-910]|nr:hypothetical protein L218DRAFT_955774 [Marasmius fiardii PR-910]
MRLICFLVDVDALQPPAKRRRGLAGSIVSTALSAALIGTAVGLTVYRFFRWRDRGKAHAPLTIAHEQPPPPPYSETEPHSQSIDSSSIPNTPDLNVIPPTPNRRHHPHRQPRSAPRRRRGGPSRAANPSFTPSSSSNAIFPNTQPQFDFSFQSSLQSSSHQPVNEVEDQMDWIGDKLSMLIQEGKRALGREVVVSSECAEDEVDDGSGGWIEEDEDGGHHGKSRSSSPRRVRRKGSQRRLQEIRHSPSSSFSGSQPSTSLPSSPSFSSTFPTSQSVPSYMSLGTDTAGSSSAYESADIQESMERARRKVLEARAARAAGAPFS